MTIDTPVLSDYEKRKMDLNFQYIEAPNGFKELLRPHLFLAGGITGCPDWQHQVSHALVTRGFKGTILNPRRANFPIEDPSAAKEQITWEYEALRLADVILFWFPKEQIQPIALFELGRWSFSGKRLVVGRDPEYPRRQDIDIQMELATDWPVYDDPIKVVDRAIELAKDFPFAP